MLVVLSIYVILTVILAHLLMTWRKTADFLSPDHPTHDRSHLIKALPHIPSRKSQLFRAQLHAQLINFHRNERRNKLKSRLFAVYLNFLEALFVELNSCAPGACKYGGQGLGDRSCRLRTCRKSQSTRFETESVRRERCSSRSNLKVRLLSNSCFSRLR